MKNPQLLLESPRLEELQEILLTALSQAGFKPGDDFHIIPLEASSDSPITDEKRFYLDEMAKLNNDLTNMQRTLAKTNVELENLAEIRNRFVGMAAHDLRNPLGVIRSFSEYLMTEMKHIANEDQLDIIQTIHSTSIFMQRLVEGILDFSTMQNGKVTLQKGQHDLVILLEQNVKLNRVLANQHKIKIILDVPNEPVLINLDAVKIRQVINNLLGNAIKYSPDESRILCSLTCHEGFAKVCFQDQGVGIPEVDQLIVFEPFKKLSSDQKRESSVGLGLSIVKNIVEAHEGFMSLNSEPGKGSTFCFLLPLAGL